MRPHFRQPPFSSWLLDLGAFLLGEQPRRGNQARLVPSHCMHLRVCYLAYERPNAKAVTLWGRSVSTQEPVWAHVTLFGYLDPYEGHAESSPISITWVVRGACSEHQRVLLQIMSSGPLYSPIYAPIYPVHKTCKSYIWLAPSTFLPHLMKGGEAYRVFTRLSNSTCIVQRPGCDTDFSGQHGAPEVLWKVLPSAEL